MAEIDYTSYTNDTDFQLTTTQAILAEKFEQALQQAENHRITLEREDENNMKILGYNLNDIPSTFKFFFFVGVFAVFIIGVLYLLKQVSPIHKANKAKADKRKERKEKKKQQ